MHTEEQLGWFFGSAAFLVAALCLCLVIFDAEQTRAGWLIAFCGWGLAGSGSIALGKERAKRNQMND